MNAQYQFPRESILIDLYGRWLEKNNLPEMSADELAMEHDKITVKQSHWLVRFIKVWEYYANNRNKY